MMTENNKNIIKIMHLLLQKIKVTLQTIIIIKINAGNLFVKYFIICHT